MLTTRRRLARMNRSLASSAAVMAALQVGAASHRALDALGGVAAGFDCARQLPLLVRVEERYLADFVEVEADRNHSSRSVQLLVDRFHSRSATGGTRRSAIVAPPRSGPTDVSAIGTLAPIHEAICPAIVSPAHLDDSPWSSSTFRTISPTRPVRCTWRGRRSSHESTPRSRHLWHRARSSPTRRTGIRPARRTS